MDVGLHGLSRQSCCGYHIMVFGRMAKKSTSIVLSDHWQRYIEMQVASGRHASASEVVRDALRLAEDRQKRVDRLNALIDEGEASGFIEDFDFDAFIAAVAADDDGEKDDERKAA